MEINYQLYLGNFSFLILFISTLIYWIQASNFNLVTSTSSNTAALSFTNSEAKYINKKSLGTIFTILANLSLFLLLILRWKESGHFPLSNLYESLMFLSWSLTLIHLFIEIGFSKKSDFNALSLWQYKLPKVFVSPSSSKNLEGFSSLLLAPLFSLRFFLRKQTQEGETKRKNKYRTKPSGFFEVEGGEGTGQDIKNAKNYNKVTALKKEKKLQIQHKTIIASRLIGSITAPSALFTNAFATFSLPKEMQEVSPLVPALQSNWLMMHVTVMILSYAALILGSLLSIGFLVITGETNTPEGVRSLAFLRKYRRNLSNKKPSGFTGTKYRTPTEEQPKQVPNEGEDTQDTDLSLSIQKKSETDILIGQYGFISGPAKNLVSQNNAYSTISLNFSPIKSIYDTLNILVAPFLTVFKGIPVDNKILISNQKPSALAFLSYGSRDEEQQKELSNLKIFKLNLARTLDNLSYRILGLGFPLLTIGILSGAVWANEAWGSYWSWDPKETWALLTWLVFAIYLHTRLTKGWEGKKPALIASLGFVSVWVCFLGVNLIGEGLHSYGWLIKP